MRKFSKKELIRIAREAGCKTFADMYNLGGKLQDVEYPAEGKNSPLPKVKAKLSPNKPSAQDRMDAFKCGKKL